MRRTNLFTTALFALLTFVALSAFVGRRGWNEHRYHRWQHEACYNDRDHDSGGPSESRATPDSSFHH